MDPCKHESFECNCTVNRIEDVGRYQVDVTVNAFSAGRRFVSSACRPAWT